MASTREQTSPIPAGDAAPLQASYQDYARSARIPGALPARISVGARATAWLVGGADVLGGGLIGGSLYCLMVGNADLLFWPMISVYVAFGFWLYAPQGYRFSDDALEVLRPRGALRFGVEQIVAVAGGESGGAFCDALAARTGAAWLARLPATETPPPDTRLLWIDPELPEFDTAPNGGANPAAIPLIGHFSIWGGCVGRFWRPGGGAELRQSRSFRPRLGLWVEGA